MQARFEAVAAQVAKPKLAPVSSAVLAAATGPLPSPYLQPRTNVADDWLRTMMTPRSWAESTPYKFYDKVTIPGQAFANMTAYTQMRAQSVEAKWTMPGDLNDLAHDINRFEHLRDDWALRYHAALGIGALVTFFGGLYEHLETSLDEETSLYEKTEAKIQLIQKVGEFVGENYLPEQVSAFMSHLIKTGDMSMAGHALVHELLHRTHLDHVIAIPSLAKDYQVLEKIKRMPIHLDFFEHNMRSLANDPSMLDKLSEYKDRIGADLVELEKMISELPRNERTKEYSDLILSFKESLSRHNDTLNILTSSEATSQAQKDSSHPTRISFGGDMDHVRAVSQMFHAQFKALRLNAASVAESRLAGENASLSELAQSHDSGLVEGSEVTHLENVEDSVDESYPREEQLNVSEDEEDVQHVMKAIMTELHNSHKMKIPEDISKALPSDNELIPSKRFS